MRLHLNLMVNKALTVTVIRNRQSIVLVTRAHVTLDV